MHVFRVFAITGDKYCSQQRSTVRRFVFWEVETIKLLFERHEGDWGVEVLLHLFLTSTLSDGTWSVSSPRRCISGKDSTPRRAVGAKLFHADGQTDRPDEPGIFGGEGEHALILRV
jgi:hypothetical protein